MNKSRGYSLIYVIFISSLLLLSITTMIIYNYDKNKMLNYTLIDNKIIFNEICKSEINISKELLNFNILEDKLKIMGININDIKNIKKWNTNTYFDSSLVYRKDKYEIIHILLSGTKSLGGYEIRNIKKDKNGYILVTLSKFIGKFCIYRLEKIKYDNKNIKVESSFFTSYEV